ncbi:hypothetical protein GGU10DRAFT_359977 [Lentinula aff. detonsa]|uniref:F-box domain-containing protein n=1 Tax=Lentinula aff. detonsa TaxID=2804958 RepID=A0AA38NIF8_9AGAR|nr:hypothetical protein GGU10DRAFT_359977 [Lentinula aff. detonsa]
MPIILPIELHELVIDELAYSFLALKNCSQVCKAWLHRCRLHLFRTLLVRPHIYNTGYSSPFFCEYQQSFSFIAPCILSYVRGLKLSYQSQNRFRSPLHSSKSPCIPISNALIPTYSTDLISFPFKQLQFLHICWDADNWGGITALEKMLQQIECLRHLVIEGRWRFRVKEDILSSVAVNAPHLKTLCLSKLRWFPNSLPSSLVEEILGHWNNRFLEKGVSPVQLDRFCITESSTKNCLIDLIKVVLRSPCLDLRSLRCLAMPASSLLRALDDERFRTLGWQVTHLAISFDTHTPVLRLNTNSLPNLSHLQLHVRGDRILHRFLSWNIPECHGASAASTPPLVHMHINFEDHSGPVLNNKEMPAMSYSGSLVHASNADPALHEFIVHHGAGIDVSMYFRGREPDTQRDCIQKLFPQTVLTGQLDWMNPNSLEWWFDYK